MSLITKIASLQDYEQYRDLHWEGSFEDYLAIVKEKPQVTRNAYHLSEKDRVGIGTFQPKDEKNQDSTELTGDINYRKIAEYGTDSDPRAFNFDGEFNIANRGISSSSRCSSSTWPSSTTCWREQEHKIKPKKFAQTDIDEVIIGHTNEPEYKKLQNNELMEAFRDRTIKIDIPYNTKLDDEIRSTRRTSTREGARQAHRAAHLRGRGDVGGPDAPRGAEEGRPHAAAEAEALQRQDPARLHRGQRQGAPRGRPPARAWTASAPLHPGQDLQRPRQRGDEELHQPLHGDERAREGLDHHSLITDEEPRSATASCSPS
jgi:serine protein kinase